jgi:hypothetical protein
MAEDKRPKNWGAERESRFVNLLQPNRDMATNWSVDVGRQLEGYLEELKDIGLFDNGHSPLNFVEGLWPPEQFQLHHRGLALRRT